MGLAMANMRARGLDRAVREAVDQGKPFLGICLGMQMLFERSEEDGADGLGIFPGIVRRIPPGPGLKIPHMGWNRIDLHGREASGGPGTLLRQGESVYFVHSYYADPEDPSITTATADHGVTFTAAVSRGSVDAFQFHPEKSGDRGIEILRRWLRRQGTSK
jgi:glutamine amidotransferase